MKNLAIHFYLFYCTVSKFCVKSANPLMPLLIPSNVGSPTSYIVITRVSKIENASYRVVTGITNDYALTLTIATRCRRRAFLIEATSLRA